MSFMVKKWKVISEFTEECLWSKRHLVAFVEVMVLTVLHVSDMNGYWKF